MSRSKKWHQEWAFFLGANGRRQYHRKCRGCTKECKQSFRVTSLVCPYFQSKDTKEPPESGLKIPKSMRCNGRIKMG